MILTIETPLKPRFDPNSKRLFRAIQFLFLGGILLLLWNLADGEQAFDLLTDAAPLMLLATLAALSLQTIFSALRWRIAALQLGIHLKRRIALREYFQSQVANQSLPGGVLGDAGRVIRSSSQAGWIKSAQAVVIERLAGQIALFSMFFAALSLSLFMERANNWPSWLLIFSLLGLLVIVTLVFSALVISKTTRGSFSLLISKAGTLIHLCLLASKVRLAQIALSIGSATMNVLAFMFASIAIGAELRLLDAFVVVPIVLLAMLIPLSIGGWGFREGAAAVLFPLVGLTATQGLAASVAFGLVFLVSSLPGLGITVLIAKDRDKKVVE